MTDVLPARNEFTLIQRESVGKRLIQAAWGVEILAAGIGLLIAVLIIIDTQTRIQNLDQGISASAGFMNAFLGGLPFIVVAVVELTKIPLAASCYHSQNKLWQFVLVLGLVFLMVITFETILNGFERNFTQRTYVIKKDKKQLIHTEEEILKNERESKVLTATTPELLRQEFEREIDQVDRNREAELQEIEHQVEQAKITHSGRESEVLREQKVSVEEEIAKLDHAFSEDKARINTEFDKKTSLGQTDIGQQQENLRERVASVKSEIDKLTEQRENELSGIKDPKDNSVALEKEIERIEADFGERISKAEKTISGEKADAEARVDKLRAEIDTLVEEKSSTLENLDFFTSTRKRDRIVNGFDEKLSSRRRDLDIARSRLNSLGTSTHISSLQNLKDNQIETTRKEFGQQASSGRISRQKIRDKYSAETSPLRQQLETLERRLANLSSQTLISEAANERDQKFKVTSAEYQKRRNEFEEQRNSLSASLAEALTENQDALLPVLERLQRRRSDISGKYTLLRQKAEERYATTQEDQKNREFQVARIRAELGTLREARLQLRDDISRKAEDSQIYRVAALWVGKDSPADITNEELRTVSFIWFGSLAAITAWTGTLLAFAGLSVRYGHRHGGQSLRQLIGATLTSSRRLFVDLRRRVRRPRIKEVEKEIIKTIEVFKEVPVDKIVFKEVPREVVRNELVYVPFFTDDPEILGKTIDEFGIVKARSGSVNPSSPPGGDEEGNSEKAAE